MKTVGIVCEYNPFHRGHGQQFAGIRQALGEETAIVCAMSGNFVQRGAPAIFHKSVRARAAVMAGADLVLELPVTHVLDSAEGFAAGGVRVLSGVCDTLCFGSESADREGLLHTAELLLTEAFSLRVREELQRGISFPAARAAALETLGGDPGLISRPNDILAVEYCKAVLRECPDMTLMPIHRPGDYHATQAEKEAPSATAVRKRILARDDWLELVPEQTRKVQSGAAVHTLEAGERAVLARLRTMSEGEFAALPFGSEGLWRKFMHASRREDTLEAVIAATKSRRYTRSRLDRMVMCAFLGLTAQTMAQEPPYVRVLAFSDRGRALLREQKKARRTFLNPGERREDPYWTLESRCGDLYGLFAVGTPEAPGSEERCRVFYRRDTEQ